MTDALLIALVTAGASFAGAWGAVRVQLQWLRAEIERAHERIDRLEAPHFATPLKSRQGQS